MVLKWGDLSQGFHCNYTYIGPFFNHYSDLNHAVCIITHIKTQVFKDLPHLYVILQIYTSLPLLLWKPRLQEKFDCRHSKKVNRHNRVRLSVPLIQDFKKPSVSAHSLTKSTQNTQTTNCFVYFFFLCCFRVDKVSVCHFDAFQEPGLLKLCMLFCLV